MAKQSLKDKTVKGVGWTAVESVLRYGVTFVVGIILARLLSPDEYGLIGLLMIFIAFFEILIDGGFINALVRRQNAQEIDYCTVFWTNLVLSVIMAAVLFIGAELIAKFFERAELVPLMHVMCFIVIIDAMALVQKARLRKALDFKTQTKVTIIAAVASGIIGIWMAYAGYGVWALVAQQISNAGLATLLYWVINRWIPKFQFSMVSFRDMWNYGWKLMLSGVLNKLSSQLHSAVIGKMFSPAILGQSTRAHQFGSIFSTNITTILQKVSFPVLSVIQNDPERLKQAYKRLIKVTVFLTFILMLTLAAIAKPLISVLIGEKWLEAAYMLQIICFGMMLHPLHALNLSGILVMGRSDLTLRINIIKNLLIIFPITVGLLTNVYWMLAADVVKGYIAYYLNAYYSKYVLNYPIKEQLKDIAPSMMTAFLIALPLYALSYLNINAMKILVIQIIVGAIWAGILLIVHKPQEYEMIKEIAINVIKKKK